MRFNIEGFWRSELGSSQCVVMGRGRKVNSGRRVGVLSYFPKEHDI